MHAHTASDAIQCLIDDFKSYIDGSVDPDELESHECSLGNALQVQELLSRVRNLGDAIESGDPQTIADIWLQIKPQVVLRQSEIFSCAARNKP